MSFGSAGSKQSRGAGPTRRASTIAIAGGAWFAVPLAALLLVVPALAGAACDPCSDGDVPVSAEVGTVDAAGAFAALDEGQGLPYVRGIQGGTHLDGAVRVQGLHIPDDPFTQAAELPTLSLTLSDEAGDRVGGFVGEPQPFTPIGEAAEMRGERVGLQVRFDGDGADFVDAVLLLDAEVIDVCGRSAADSRHIRVLQSE